jgi:hypothetical protein
VAAFLLAAAGLLLAFFLAVDFFAMGMMVSCGIEISA